MQRDDDDDAWRAIIENYGERPDLGDDPGREVPEPAPPPASYVVTGPGPDDIRHPTHPEAFVAPNPPLPPTPTRDRQLAWAGLIGSPVVLMVFLVASVRIPSLVAYALIAGFVGGFLYLVFHLPRSHDDPFDDGARV